MFHLNSGDKNAQFLIDFCISYLVAFQKFSALTGRFLSNWFCSSVYLSKQACGPTFYFRGPISYFCWCICCENVSLGLIMITSRVISKLIKTI